MAIYRLFTAMMFTRTIEEPSIQLADKFAKQDEKEANKHNHHGEITRVVVISPEKEAELTAKILDVINHYNIW